MVAFNPNVREARDEIHVIFCYTREQAIKDGVLVDLMQQDTAHLVREAGFKLPIAMTCGAYAKAVAPAGGNLPEGQDVTGRIWDILNMLRMAVVCTPRQTDRVHFQVMVHNGKEFEKVRLWALIGPGDTRDPVITIMLEGED
nr:hypothetical protein 9 [Flavobacteriaceae bacterium]